MNITWTCIACKKTEKTSCYVSSVMHKHGENCYSLTPFKKEKKPANNIKILKTEVWDLFSEWVRRSEADENGFGRCVTCGRILNWRDADAGHYIHGTLFLIPELVHFQCKPCNGFGHGNLIPYKEFMLKKYGQKALDKFEYMAKLPHKYTVFELNQFKKLYQGKLKELG